MGKRRAPVLLLVLVMCNAVAMVDGYNYGDEDPELIGEREEVGGERGEIFVLERSKSVFKTDAGEMRVFRGYGGRIVERPMQIGSITMEPNSLFIPQYLDSSLILFIRTGEARLGSIYKDELVERRLRTGDVYRIEAGSTFYLLNTGEGQRLHVICSIDTSESLRLGTFQSFFIGGGTYPTSILAGFDPETMATAFNVSISELREVMTRQQEGPIVYLDTHSPSMWTQFHHLKEHERLAHLKRVVHFREKSSTKEDEENKPRWSLRKLLISLFGIKNKRGDGKRSSSPDSYNIYDRSPDFKNNYGWSIALDDSDYSSLRRSGIGIYLVNLTAGSMMAPHVNPTATEYGIVLRGTGTIQIVFPNGTLAMNTKVSEGNVFWVPRYFPFCQIASRTGPFEFFGFTTSARKNRPQFLVGSNSILHSMRGPEFAAAFGVSDKRLGHIIDAQREGVILPSPSVAPHKALKGEEEEWEEKIVRNFGNDLIMGFD